MSQEGFANLDVYEGVPHHYVRQDVTISLRDAGLRSPHLTSLAAPACDMFCLRSLGAEGMNGRPRAQARRRPSRTWPCRRRRRTV